MIRTLGLLQRVQRLDVRLLPLEPRRHPRDRLRLTRAAAVDSEWIARVGPLGTRVPFPAALDRDDAHFHRHSITNRRSGMD